MTTDTENFELIGWNYTRMLLLFCPNLSFHQLDWIVEGQFVWHECTDRDGHMMRGHHLLSSLHHSSSWDVVSRIQFVFIVCFYVIYGVSQVGDFPERDPFDDDPDEIWGYMRLYEIWGYMRYEVLWDMRFQRIKERWRDGDMCKRVGMELQHMV